MVAKKEVGKKDDTKPQVKEPVKRVYSNNLVIDSDLFKLEVGNMIKNVGSDDKVPVLVGIEHCHFYRTFDSNGRETDKCAFVGGHTHQISVSSEDGNLVAECSTPIGSKYAEDKHTHKIRYIKSDKVEKRRINNDAQQYIAKMSSV